MLLCNELPEVEPDVLAQLPAREYLKRVIRWARHAKLPAIPKTLCELKVVEGDYQKMVINSSSTIPKTIPISAMEGCWCSLPARTSSF